MLTIQQFEALVTEVVAGLPVTIFECTDFWVSRQFRVILETEDPKRRITLVYNGHTGHIRAVAWPSQPQRFELADPEFWDQLRASIIRCVAAT